MVVSILFPWYERGSCVKIISSYFSTPSADTSTAGLTGACPALAGCKDSKVSGCIVVDSNNNAPEDKEIFTSLSKENVSYIKLIAPTNGVSYIKKSLLRCSSFLYVVSIAGTTGSKQVNLKNVKKSIQLVRKVSKIPIGVGFGIKTKEDVSKVSKVADAVIVGSGIVDIIGKNAKNHNLTKKIGSYLKNLKKGLKK